MYYLGKKRLILACLQVSFFTDRDGHHSFNITAIIKTCTKLSLSYCIITQLYCIIAQWHFLCSFKTDHATSKLKTSIQSSSSSLIIFFAFLRATRKGMWSSVSESSEFGGPWVYSVAGNVSENKLYFCSEILKKRKPLNSFYISCSGVLLPTVTSLYTYIYSYQKDFRF